MSNLTPAQRIDRFRQDALELKRYVHQTEYVRGGLEQLATSLEILHADLTKAERDAAKVAELTEAYGAKAPKPHTPALPDHEGPVISIERFPADKKGACRGCFRSPPEWIVGYPGIWSYYCDACLPEKARPMAEHHKVFEQAMSLVPAPLTPSEVAAACESAGQPTDDPAEWTAVDIERAVLSDDDGTYARWGNLATSGASAVGPFAEIRPGCLGPGRLEALEGHAKVAAFVVPIGLAVVIGLLVYRALTSLQP